MSNETKTPNPQPVKAAAATGLQTTHVILTLGVVAIIAAAVVVTIILTRTVPETETLPVANNSTGAKVINENNMEQIMGEISESVAKGMFMTHMNTNWRFVDGASPSYNAVMGNHASNNYPMWFEVTINGTEELIYSSDLLPLGSQVQEIILNRDLDAGKYPATININMIDENGDAVESTMGFGINLIIEN